MAAATVPRPVPESPHAAPVGAGDRIFYSAMAIAMAMTVVGGFAPTYYGRFFQGGPRATLSGGPFTALVHLHGALFTGWMLLFVVQTALVASRRVAVHRRLGIAGSVLAAAMVAVGTLTALAAAARGASPPGVDPLAFLAIPLFDMVLFAGFVTAALVKRRDKEAHKRWMLLAYASIIVAAAARLPGVLAAGPIGFFAVAFLFVVAGAVYDRVSRGRIHRAYLWGGLLFVASVPPRLALSGTSAWRHFAEFLTRQV
jgi:hypothetical protein